MVESGPTALLGALVGALLVLGGCGSEPIARPEHARTAPTMTSTPTEPKDQGPTMPAIQALSLDQLRGQVLDAVRSESSVHESVGNLTPPPDIEVVQDYTTENGDLQAVFNTEPGHPPVFDVRRVGGQVSISFDGGPFKPVSAQQITEAEETPLISLLRTDVVKDLVSLFAGVVKGEFKGVDASLGAGVTRYDLRIKTAAWFRAKGGETAFGLKHSLYPAVVPSRLWISGAGLPVRLEVKYSEPIGGLAGTGTIRIDYSHWSERVEVERP